MKTTSAKLTLQLIKIGLSEDEAMAYHALWRFGSMLASEVADHIKVLDTAVYRLMSRLIVKGFVVELNTSPKTFQAVPPYLAIENYVSKQTSQLEQTKQKIISSLSHDKLSPTPTRMELITSQRQWFSTYIKYAKQARREILTISIGEPVPDDIKLVIRDAVERGVDVKFLFHKYNRENESLLRAWVAMKTEVRHYPDAGYHLVIYDGKTSILVANNPKNTAERSGFVIFSPSLSEALREHFYSRWNKAVPVK